jgi:excisionase family DNA binding protein
MRANEAVIATMPRKRKEKPELVDLSLSMTAEEAAVALGVSVATVHRWRRGGLLRFEKMIGRVFFDRAQVEELAKKNR